MKKEKKQISIWVLFLIDILGIALGVGSFYFFYYVKPRALESEYLTAQRQELIQQAELEQEQARNENKLNQNMEEDSTESKAENVQENQINQTLSWKEKFSDQFTESIYSSETEYTSPNLSIQIEQISKGSGNDKITYYIADIYVADITCFQTAFAKDTYGIGYTEEVLDMDMNKNAILAMNGDYYGTSNSGVVIRNGEVYRTDIGDADVCVLYYDGTMKTYSAREFDIEQIIQDGAYQAWTFGPALLNESGKCITSFSISRRMQSRNPRSGIGYYEPGHYCFVVVDGRSEGYSNGMKMSEFSRVFEELGCSAAYNLDGGKSSIMTFEDTVVNQPVQGGRAVSDMLYLKEVE